MYSNAGKSSSLLLMGTLLGPFELDSATLSVAKYYLAKLLRVYIVRLASGMAMESSVYTSSACDGEDLITSISKIGNSLMEMDIDDAEMNSTYWSSGNWDPHVAIFIHALTQLYRKE